MRLLQVGRVDDHGEPGLQCGSRQLVQVAIGRFAGLLAVDAAIELACLRFGLLAVQTLALDIRAQTHRAERFDQA